LSSAEGPIRVRRAVAGDADLLLEWANDPATRAASLSSGSIARSEHVAWLDRVVGDQRTGLWIGFVGERPVGQVRVALDEAGDGEVSISVAPGERGHGLAVPLLEAGLNAATDLGVTEFVAHVRPENEPSRRLFDRAGFRSVGRVERDGVDVVELRRRPAGAGTGSSS